MGTDNGTGNEAGKAPEAPSAAKPIPPSSRLRFRLGKDTVLHLSIGTLGGIIAGVLAITGAILGVWYTAKARADTLEVRVGVIEDQTERRDQLFDHGMNIVQTAQVAVAALQVEIEAQKRERILTEEANAAAHKALALQLEAYQGEVRMLARSKEPR